MENRNNNKQLSPEEIKKTDRDIKRIMELTKATTSFGGTLVLMGGYAVEALTGGMITRPHDDVDLEFYLPQDCNLNNLSNVYIDIINPDHDSNWEKTLDPDKAFFEYKNNSGSKLQKIEGYIFKLSPTPAFESPGKLSVRIKKSNGTEYEMPLESVTLIDSEGKSYDVYTQALNEFAALKMQRLQSQDNDPWSRQFKPSDHSDLKRLVEMPEFSKQSAVEMLTGTLTAEEGISTEKAQQQALDIVNKSLSDLGVNF